jgi:hypothetical protein
MLEAYIEQLVKTLDISIPKDDKIPGCFHLTLDEGITITEIPDSREWELKASFGAIPNENREALFTKMLLGNLFNQGTRGSSLGINEEGSKLVLTYRKSLPEKYEKFYNDIEDFMDVIELWKTESAPTK